MLGNEASFPALKLGNHMMLAGSALFPKMQIDFQDCRNGYRLGPPDSESAPTSRLSTTFISSSKTAQLCVTTGV
jgi:hypothetical protein